MHRSNVSRRFVVSRLAAASAALSAAPVFSGPLVPAAADGYRILHRFGGKKRGDGDTPSGGLVQATDGFLYGLTSAGGRRNGGCIYRLKDQSTERVVYSFVPASGDVPLGELVQGTDGAFYGTTEQGGANDAGSIFRIDATSSYQLLYSFEAIGTGNLSGYYPAAGLCQGPDGLFYGVTSSGGAAGGGTAFRIGSANTFELLRDFDPVQDGSTPLGALIYGNDGLFYGTTSAGGSRGGGSVFSMQLGGSIPWLYSFEGGNNAKRPNQPFAGLTMDAAGMLYGTTRAGGKTDRVGGAVFSLVPGTADLTVLHAFVGDDGLAPEAPVTLGEDGLLYGSTSAGGGAGKGTIFRLGTDGNSFNTLHEFAGGTRDSARPTGRLLASGGRVYGVTAGDADDGLGTVFVLDPAAAA